MPETFDYATTDPGAGGENLAGDRLTQGAVTLFVPAAYLVHGAAGGPYSRVEAGAGLPVAQAGGWTVGVSGTVAVTATDLDVRALSSAGDSVAAVQSGAWTVTVQDGGGAITVDGSVTVSATNLDVRDLTSVSDSVSAVQSGAWTVGVSGTVAVSAAALPLPTGAATEATLSALNGKVTACDTGAVVISSGAVTVSASNLDVRDLTYASDSVTAHQGGSWTVTVQDGGGALTVDGSVTVSATDLDVRDLAYASDSVTAHQGGSWAVRAQDGSGNALTSAARGSERALSVQLVDASGAQVTSFGGGTQYTDGDTDATPTGVLIMFRKASGDIMLAVGDDQPLPVDVMNAVPVTDNSGSLTVDGTVGVSGTVSVQQGTGTSVLSNVSGSASSVTLLSANADRHLAVVYNDSAATLYVKFGATASASSYTYLLASGDTLEVTHYTGRIDGIWSSATGSARVTEVD